MASLPRDENLVPVLGLVDSVTGLVRPALADSSTGRLLVSGTGGGGGFANPMTTLGDIITGGVAGTPGRLGIGTAGQVLTVVAGVPAWSTVSGTGDVVGPASATDNAVARFDGTTGKLIQNSAVTIADTSGDITAGKYNGLTVTASTGTLTIANAKVLTASNTLTFTGTDGSSVAFGAGGTVLYANQTITLSGDVTGSGTTAITTTVAAIAGTAVSGTTGSGNVVFSTSPTLVTPALGTPSALVGTNITGTAAGLTAGTVTTNANLTGPITSVGNATSIASQTGTGTKFVVDTSPTLVTPVLGVATATSINKVAITAPASSATLTIADGKTLTVNKSLTLDGTDSTTMTFPTTSASIARTDAGQTFTGVQTMTSPSITTSLTTGSSSFDLLNATATTVNFAGAATTMAVGATTALITVPGNIISTNNAITASGNAATVPITRRVNTVTNNSAATLTITITTTSAVEGQLLMVRILDASAAAQTITWVNTENSTVSAPTTSNGSTTLPLTVGFQYNSATSKWRCIASA